MHSYHGGRFGGRTRGSVLRGVCDHLSHGVPMGRAVVEG